MKYGNDFYLLRSYSRDQGGVFTISDLQNMFAAPHLNTLYRRIRKLESAGVLKRFCKGIYVTEGFNIEILSHRLCPSSYISFENVLSRELIIGPSPENQVKAIKRGKSREYFSDGKSIIHRGISKDLFFGFKATGGINYATPEKALLDILYFHLRGMKFIVDIYSDINIQRVEKKIIRKYLKNYKNKKYVKFVENYLNEA